MNKSAIFLMSIMCITVAYGMQEQNNEQEDVSDIITLDVDVVIGYDFLGHPPIPYGTIMLQDRDAVQMPDVLVNIAAGTRTLNVRSISNPLLLALLDEQNKNVD